MKTEFTPTEEEATSFTRQTRGTIRRRIEPQPWTAPHDPSVWMWKRPASVREFDMMWVAGAADDMLDEACPLAKRGRIMFKSDRGLKIKAESVHAEKGPDGWEWVINWRIA